MSDQEKRKYVKPVVRDFGELASASGEVQACSIGNYAGVPDCLTGSSYIDCSGGPQVHTTNCSIGRGAYADCTNGREEVGCNVGLGEDFSCSVGNYVGVQG